MSRSSNAFWASGRSLGSWTCQFVVIFGAFNPYLSIQGRLAVPRSMESLKVEFAHFIKSRGRLSSMRIWWRFLVE